jgi:hypothetical protein
MECPIWPDTGWTAPQRKLRSDERKQFVSPGDALEFVSTCMVQDESFVAGNVVAYGWHRQIIARHPGTVARVIT